MIIYVPDIVYPIELVRRLEIQGNNKVPVPGCEPTSTLTSYTLMREQRRICKHTLVDLQDALDAIPGSTVEFGINDGPLRKRWFVLPPTPIGCCLPVVDYYAILRGLEGAEPFEENRFDNCNTIGMGFCPSPDFTYREPHNTYIPEGVGELRSRYTP